MVENHSLFAITVVSEFLSEHEVDLRRMVWTAINTYPNDYDAMLVDYDLGDGKGDRVVRWARGRGYTGRIIAISARAEGNEALLEAGADAVCNKLDFAQIGKLLSKTALRG